MFTDTHTHLTHPALFFRLPNIIAQARAAQVSQFIVPTAEHAEWATALALLRQPEIRAVALGIHPWHAEQASPSALHELAQHLHQHPALLVGEIGLDFYDKTQSPERRAAQIQAFQAQLALAARLFCTTCAPPPPSSKPSSPPNSHAAASPTPFQAA